MILNICLSIAAILFIIGIIWHIVRKPKVKPDPNYIDPIEIDNVKYKHELVLNYNRLVTEHNKLETRYRIIRDKDSVQAQAFAKRLFDKALEMKRAQTKMYENGIRPL